MWFVYPHLRIESSYYIHHNANIYSKMNCYTNLSNFQDFQLHNVLQPMSEETKYGPSGLVDTHIRFRILQIKTVHSNKDHFLYTINVFEAVLQYWIRWFMYIAITIGKLSSGFFNSEIEITKNSCNLELLIEPF